VPAKGTSLDVTVETRNSKHAAEILSAFTAEGYVVQPLTPGKTL
jgi:hypothetical protein